MPKMIVDNITTDQLCDYGCGKIAQFRNRSNKLTCAATASACEANKIKNRNGVRASNATGRRKNAKQIYADLPPETKSKMAWNKGEHNADFSYNGKGSHKKILIRERGHACESCKLTEWLCNPIPLELEHVDGDNKNQVKDNLLLLCPNCHARTRFYRGRNINSGKTKVSDEQLLQEIAKGLNNREILLKIGLTPKGGNYKRLNNLRYAPLAQSAEAGDLGQEQSVLISVQS